jgi:DNA invertase Pin-like site-specific DNA recombinase
VKTTAPSRAIGYVRVSTDQQAESGLGLEGQEAAVRAAASRLRLDIVRVFVDGGTSGKLGIEDRPVLLEAVGALRRGDVLLVAKRDRLGRDVIAVAMIERLVAKRGARVISAAGEGTESDDPAGVLMRRLIDSFAEYERLIISARTRAALAAKRRRGERVSGIVPFGYRLAADGRTLEVDAQETTTLEAIQRLRAEGRSLRAVADALNAAGVPTRARTPWRFEYVRNLLRGAAQWDTTVRLYPVGFRSREIFSCTN